MKERKIRYKEGIRGGSAWAVAVDDYWSLYNRNDVWIGDVKKVGGFFRFSGTKGFDGDQKFVSYVLNTLNQKLYTPVDSYVYLVFVDKYLRYIGKGVGNRYLHAISGTSHVYSLNRAYFGDSQIEVLCYADGLPEENALRLEESLISLWSNEHTKNLYNTKSTNRQLNHYPTCTEDELYLAHKHKLLGVKVGDEDEYEYVVDFVEYDFEKVYGVLGKDLNGFTH